MKIHPTSIEGFDSLEDAAVAVGKMRYDAIAVFLWHLVEELDKQQRKDEEVGKKQLAEDSIAPIVALCNSEAAMRTLFQKYKKYMKEELEITPEIKYK